MISCYIMTEALHYSVTMFYRYMTPHPSITLVLGYYNIPYLTIHVCRFYIRRLRYYGYYIILLLHEYITAQPQVITAGILYYYTMILQLLRYNTSYYITTQRSLHPSLTVLLCNLWYRYYILG